MSQVVLMSADSHIQEPMDLWQTRLPKELRDRGPRVERSDEWTVLYVEGREWDRYHTIRREDGSLLEFEAITSPADRLKDLDLDGVWAETPYASLGFSCLTMKDPELAMACARVYNDFIADTFGPYRDRQCPIPIVPVADVQAAVSEIERVASLGSRGVSLPITPPKGRPYSLDIYDPIWAAAQAHGFPVSFHAGAGDDRSPQQEAGADPLGSNPRDTIITVGPLMLHVGIGWQAQAHVATLVGSGVLERFPDLHVILVETGAGFLGWLMAAMDDAAAPPSGRGKDKVKQWRGVKVSMKWHLPLRPSEYVRRQVHATFMNDSPALANIPMTGVEPLLWGSDYPHSEGTYPRSREVTQEMFKAAGVDDPGIKAAVLGGTLARLYGLTVPEATAV